MDLAFSQLNILLQSIAAAWNATWWIVLPAIALVIFWDFWKIYLHVRFVKKLNWQLLELKIPKNILKTPKAMEQIFATAHAPYNYGIPFMRKYWKGVEEVWMAFEIVGRAGESHFYLRVPGDYRHMMESAIYAQYPEAEIVDAENYLNQFPKNLPNENFDVSGFEEQLRKENYLPIRTYLSFEEPVEEQRLDPMGPILEAMSQLKEDQQLWYQLVIRPTGEDFQKEGEAKITKMMGLEEKKKPRFFEGFGLGVTLGDVIAAPFRHPDSVIAPKKDDKQKTQRVILSATEKKVSEGIQEKIAKLAFEATPRFVFINRRGESDEGFLNTVHGFIRQFNTQDMNSLKPDKKTSTAGYTVKGPFKKTKLQFRKRIMYDRYRDAVPSKAKSILNIEELATIFHFPITAVSTTELEKIASRKGSPPASVPTIED